MKSKLTKKERDLIPVVRNEWLARLNSLEFDEGKAKNMMYFLYDLVKLKKPKVIICDSPWQFSKYIEGEIGSEIEGEIGREIWREIGREIWSEIGREIGREIRREIGREIWSEIEGEIESGIYWSYGDVFDYNWIAFYDYFRRIGMKADFSKFNEMLKHINGAWFTITLKNKALVGRPPIYMKRDENGRLHCLDGACLEWRDGKKIYAIDGVIFRENEHMKFREGMSAKEIMAEKNTEKRAVMIKYTGIENMVSELESKKINSFIHKFNGKEYEYVLWDFGLPIRYVQCPDYSTERTFFLGVPGDMNTAKEAVAWTYEEDPNAYWLEMEMRT